ncbi:hypothetical protein [Streptomyces longwoodensis]|uniref:hypothetical protein n=1 Tax=Streptomyces longwoodensis TaxID=68231 RepID=UPI0033C29E31
MTATNPSWIDGLPLTAYRARRIDSVLTMHAGTALGARSGIVPGTNGLLVTLSGTTITVGSGIAVIYAANQGVYRVPMTATSTLTLQAAHATLPRIDLVYLRVWDNSVDAGGQDTADVVYLPGTAASSPVAPTPAGTQIYMPLATINVPASGSGSPSVSTAVRPYTVAPGGILPSSSAPPSPYVGQYYDDGTNLLRFNGTGWDAFQKAPGAWTAWTPTWTTSTGLRTPSYGNAAVNCRYSKLGRNVLFYMDITFGTTTNFGSSPTSSDNWTFSLPTPAAVAFVPAGTAHIEPGNGQRASMAMAQINSDAATISLHVSGPRVDGSATVAGVVDSITPFVWGSTMRLAVHGHYESAS